jgi:peptidyl-prolyl cis-trans isomerase C
MAPQVILSAVDELLWMQRANEHGWTLTDERLNEIIGSIRKANNLEDEAAFKRALATEGLTEEKLRQQIGRTALIQQAQQVDVYEKINVTDEEVRAYYEANRQQFTKPAEITLREILIPVPTTDKGINVAQSEAAKALADATRKRLLAGEPFPSVAAEVSASSTKSNGGIIGPLKIDDLDPALQKQFGAMAVGDITEVTTTSRGYQIFKLDARTQPTTLPMEEVRPQISRNLGEQKSQGEMLKYLEKLRAQAKINWKHDELHKAYDRALTQRLERMGVSTPGASPKS